MKKLAKLIPFVILILLLLLIILIIFKPFTNYKDKSPTENKFTAESGDYNFTLQQRITPRYYKVHIPTSYNKNNPTSLIFAFHGKMGNGEHMKKNYNFVEKSDKEGFIVIFPTGANKNGLDRWAS